MFEDLISDKNMDEEAIELLREARRELKRLEYERNMYKKDSAEHYADAKRFAKTLGKIKDDPDKALDILKELSDLEDDLVDYGLVNDNDPSVDITSVDDSQKININVYGKFVKLSLISKPPKPTGQVGFNLHKTNNYRNP